MDKLVGAFAAVLILSSQAAFAQNSGERWKIVSGGGTSITMVDAATVVSEGSRRTFWQLVLQVPEELEGRVVDEVRFHVTVNCQTHTYQPLRSRYFFRGEQVGFIDEATPARAIEPETAGEDVEGYVCHRRVSEDVANIPLITYQRARDFFAVWLENQEQ